MAAPAILHMLSPLKHVSPFDANMALDAGYDAVLPYMNVETKEVAGLVQDAIFSRSPKNARRTGIFIGGRQAGQALEMLDAARKAMVPPFQVSVFADPAGSFTTAAAMVAVVEKALADKSDSIQGRRVVIFGGTGIVAYAAGVIAAKEGAEVTLVGYDGPDRVREAAQEASKRFEVEVGSADGSTDAMKVDLVSQADVVLSAGRAGVQILSAQQLAASSDLKVAADVNAVPPLGIEGVGVQDKAKPLPGGKGVGIGALAVGAVKYQVESGLFKRMIEAEKPVYLDFRDAFELAREIAGR